MSRSTIQPARISRVLPGSIAEELGIEVGDRLVKINGIPPRDLIDYQFAIADEYLELEILDAQGELHHIDLEKDWDDELGIEFDTALFDGLIQCNNACPFCFIDQQPPETRATLHLKDDDYRLSFLYGSYLTLTNLPASEWDRIAQLRLSPLYVSVHTTEPDLRSRLLKNPRAGLIMEQLTWFESQRLQIHAQIVLCPGWNDQEHLTRTLRDLARFHPPKEDPDPPTVISAAVVPVGLTRFRPSLDPLTPVDPSTAEQVITQVEDLQAQFRQTLGTSFAWLSDEWYLLAGKPLPPQSHYEDFPQIGNGVGSLRLFISEFEQLSLPKTYDFPVKLSWVVGNAVGEAFRPIAERLNQIKNLTFQLYPIRSDYWGQTLTATGLLTGQDILRSLQGIPLGDALLLPEIALKDRELFLDDVRLRDLEEAFGIPVVLVGGGAAGLLKGIHDSLNMIQSRVTQQQHHKPLLLI
jgi:putative radical SAM enzyme (TIGR03279 family)